MTDEQPASTAEVQAEVAATTTEVVADAFGRGVSAGEEAARRDEMDRPSREEFNQLRADLEALALRTGTAEAEATEAAAVAESAAVVAVVAAETAVEASDGSGAGDDTGDGPNAPQPRSGPAEGGGETDSKPAKKDKDRYGANWLSGNR
jgi:hypothetical protein